MGATPHNKTRYAAFISYAHADEVMAARLHKALETYAVPRHLRAQGKTTKPVFRDVAELTAAHSLSEKIRDAVMDSRVLIVLCSPAAKASHWVNEEIRLFRKLHGDAAILSAIIEGTPETAFPDALIEGGREPLAAALGSDKAGFRLGVTQLAAGMLGTGLDDLVQRESKRRNRLMGAGLAASLALSGIMGFATLQAVSGQNEAERARGEAEGLVEYMIKDLKFKLEPVGRLDLLQGIGDKAVEYYDKQDIKTLPDDSLTRQAAARQVLAQVHLDAGRMEEAQKEIEASAALTREVLLRNPEDTDAIYAQAQSQYWVGAYYRKQGKLAEMEKPWREYDRLAQVLYKKDPTNFDWVMEAAWGQNNLGIWAREQYSSKHAKEALRYYSASIRYFEKAIELDPISKLAKIELSNVMSGKGEILLALEDKKTAESYQLDYLKDLGALASSYPDDVWLKSRFIMSKIVYHRNFFIEHNEQNITSTYKAFDDLFELTKYDTENVEFKKLFLDSVFENMNILSREGLIKTKQQAETLLSYSQNFNSQDILYYRTMLSIMDIKINKLSKQVELAKMTLKKLNEVYKNADDENSTDRRVFYMLYLENLEQSNSDAAKYFAQKFLDKMEDISDLDFPLPSFHKMEANFTLKNCIKVTSLAQNLRARGYIDNKLYKEFYCA